MSVRELPDLMLTVKETASRLKISPSHAKRLIATGEVPSVKVGRCRRVRLTDLGAYIDGLTCDIAPARVAGATSQEDPA